MALGDMSVNRLKEISCGVAVRGPLQVGPRMQLETSYRKYRYQREKNIEPDADRNGGVTIESCVG